MFIFQFLGCCILWWSRARKEWVTEANGASNRCLSVLYSFVNDFRKKLANNFSNRVTDLVLMSSQLGNYRYRLNRTLDSTHSLRWVCIARSNTIFKKYYFFKTKKKHLSFKMHICKLDLISFWVLVWLICLLT